MKQRIIILALIICFSLQAPTMNVAAQTTYTILIDYSHGQYSSSVESIDQYLADNLAALGYDVVFVLDELSSTILSTAQALILSSVYDDGFTSGEISSISSWFSTGNKFLWVAGDSDFCGLTYVNENASFFVNSINMQRQEVLRQAMMN